MPTTGPARNDEKPARAARRRAPAGVPAKVCLALITVALLGAGGFDLGGALGIIGTPARLSVRHCRVSGAGRYTNTVCEGVLRSAGGRVLAPHASVDASATPGRTIAVREMPAGGPETVGPPAVIGWGSLFLAGWALAILGGRMVLPRARQGRLSVVSAVAGLVAACLCVLGIPAYLVALAVH